MTSVGIWFFTIAIIIFSSGTRITPKGLILFAIGWTIADILYHLARYAYRRRKDRDMKSEGQ